MPHEPEHGEYNPPPREEAKQEESITETGDEEIAELEKEIKETEERNRQKGIKRGLKKRLHEARHPVYARVRKQLPERVRSAKQGAAKSVRQIGHEIKEERRIGKQFPYGAPKVYARPTKARFARPQATRGPQMEINYGGSEPSGLARMLGDESSGYRQTPQIDLLGHADKRREIDLLGNKGNNNKKKIRLI